MPGFFGSSSVCQYYEHIPSPTYADQIVVKKFQIGSGDLFGLVPEGTGDGERRVILAPFRRLGEVNPIHRSLTLNMPVIHKTDLDLYKMYIV